MSKPASYMYCGSCRCIVRHSSQDDALNHRGNLGMFLPFFFMSTKIMIKFRRNQFSLTELNPPYIVMEGKCACIALFSRMIIRAANTQHNTVSHSVADSKQKVPKGGVCGVSTEKTAGETSGAFTFPLRLLSMNLNVSSH